MFARLKKKEGKNKNLSWSNIRKTRNKTMRRKEKKEDNV